MRSSNIKGGLDRGTNFLKFHTNYKIDGGIGIGFKGCNGDKGCYQRLGV